MFITHKHLRTFTWQICTHIHRITDAYKGIDNRTYIHTHAHADTHKHANTHTHADTYTHVSTSSHTFPSSYIPQFISTSDRTRNRIYQCEKWNSFVTFWRCQPYSTFDELPKWPCQKPSMTRGRRRCGSICKSRQHQLYPSTSFTSVVSTQENIIRGNQLRSFGLLDERDSCVEPLSDHIFLTEAN